MGQVCSVHEEFYETECRWCEPKHLQAPQPEYPMTPDECSPHVWVVGPWGYPGSCHNCGKPRPTS